MAGFLCRRKDLLDVYPNPPPKDYTIPRHIEAETGLPLRSVYDEMDRGRFPQQVQLGKRRVGWFADEIAAWREEKRRIRDERLSKGLPPVDIPSANPKAKRSVGRPRKHPAKRNSRINEQ